MGKDKDLIRTQYSEQAVNQQRQNEWQSGENAIDRAWQEAQWMREFTSEVEQQNKMFDKETQRWLEQQEYNSPANQVARLRAAGVNPASLVGSLSTLGGSASGSSGASSPSPSAPSGHSVSPLGLSAPSIASADAALFTSIAQLSDSMSKMAQTGVEGAKTAATIKPIIANTLADTRSKQAQAAFTDLQRSIAEVYGKDDAAASVLDKVSSAFASFAKGDLDKAQQQYTAALTDFTNTQHLQSKEQFPQVLANLQKTGELLGAQTGAAWAASKRDVAQAGLAVAQTETENVMRQERLTGQQLVNGISEIDKTLKERANLRDALTNQAQVDKVLFNAREQQLITEQQLQQIQKAIKDNNSYEVRMWFDLLNKIAPSVVVSP